MKNQISVREAITAEETARFWRELGAYHDRDIFANAESEEREYFHGSEYREAVQAAHDRAADRCYYLFFGRGGIDIGFALASLFTSEDGKLFILEFCVLPEYRGSGTGHDCAAALLGWARARGMKYAELNCAEERRVRFWKSLGFVPNGVDEWGEPLMLLPPEEDIPFTVEAVSAADWQLLKLENGFRSEIGGYRCIGMCSVAAAFSSFRCENVGIFEDFYIEPVFRGHGGARQLTDAAHSFGRERGYTDITVTCAPCDEDMYNSLGFATRLGSVYANI